jgi:hypothetical protein
VLDLLRQTWYQRSVQNLLISRVDAAVLSLTSGEALLVGGYDEREVRNALATGAAPHRPALVVDFGVPQWAPRADIAAALTDALQTGWMSDVQLRSFKLHRAVLSARCPHLLRLIDESDRCLAEIDDGTYAALFAHLYGNAPLQLPARTRAELASILRLAYLRDEDCAGDVRAQDAMAAFFDDDAERERTADLTFACGDVRMRVHRFFVCRSEHFRLVLSAGMAEQMRGEVCLDDVEPGVVRAFLRYLYCDALVCDADSVVDLLAVADRFGAHALKQHAEAAIETTYDFTELANVVDLVDIAERYGAAHLLRVALNAIGSDFASEAVLRHIASVDGVISESAVALIRAAVK